MVERTVTVPNETGLHARPATDLVKLSQQFESEILLFTAEERINAKSIVSVLAGGVMQGDVVRLEASGPDEARAADEVESFIKNLTD